MPNEEAYSTTRRQYDEYTDDNASGGVNIDPCRLYVTNIPKNLDDNGLRTIFSKYGDVSRIFLSKDESKRYCFVLYDTASEASLAMMQLNKMEPLKLNITYAHNKNPQKHSNQNDVNQNKRYGNPSRDSGSRDTSFRNEAEYKNDRSYRKDGGYRNDDMFRNDSFKESNSWKPDEHANSVGKASVLEDEDFDIEDDVELELKKLDLKELELKEAQIRLKKQMLLNRAGKKNVAAHKASNRCILPDGRIVVQNTERSPDIPDQTYSSAAGDSRAMKTCSCHMQQKWDDQSSEGTSSPSTCVLCSEDRSLISKESQGKFTKDSRRKSLPRCDRSNFDTSVTKSVDSRKFVTKFSRLGKNTEFTKSDYSYVSEAEKSRHSSVIRKKHGISKRSDILTCDVKSSLFESDADAADETERLISLRNVDYMDVVDDNLKIAVGLSGYPKSKMRLQQIEKFQRSLKDILDMQLHEGLLKKMPIFLDYYLNRGCIVCICKDADTRDWLVRVSAGLQDRMNYNLKLLKTKVKRLCLAITKIPRSCWPASARDAFNLLQYFNPNLKTHLWKIYSQKVIDDVEYTSFVIDDISGELIRGSTFKNVIDYSQMEFELSGFTEVYYDSFLSDMEEDLSSVASRVKLLQELRSNDTTPRIFPTNVVSKEFENEKTKSVSNTDREENMNEKNFNQGNYEEIPDTEHENYKIEPKTNEEARKFNEEIYSNYEEAMTWAENSNDQEEEKNKPEDIEYCEPSTSAIAVSERTESILESSENLVVDRNCNLNIDSNRGIAYHRRTNYLHVESELKIAIVLEGYPQNKLEGTHIRRLKHLFKEYLHKDMKMQRFANMIIPKFQDTYLSNGAVIYICDSLETKDYLTEVLPKLIKSTGLKLTFRDIKDLLRYTRIIMRLPKEISHVESLEILLKLKESYPGLKPDCWKYYSDVAGKQKRQFGVDPESLEVIKSPDFDSTFDGKKIDFRIIDRQKRDISFEERIPSENTQTETNEIKQIHDKLLKNMYCSIEPDIMNAPLTRIRANHYTDLIADDLKLYVGPLNYPEIRIDEVLFYSIKRTLECIVFDTWNKDSNSFIPKLYDIYLFDGVIFVICKDFASREWVENHIDIINQKLQLNLKATEFRGAVGIISMIVKSNKSTEEVIATLQKQNPRLRTKYWRKISTVRTALTLDVVLQIDKLSAQVITNKDFNGVIDNNAVQFKLGHLKSLINPKRSLEQINKTYTKKQSPVKSQVLKARDSNIMEDFDRKNDNIKDNNYETVSQSENVFKHDMGSDSTNIIVREGSKLKLDENKALVFANKDVEIKSDYEKNNFENTKEQDYCSVILKVPLSILPETKDGLEIIFDLLQDKNPGLNTELWTVKGRSQYNKGKFNIIMDKQSVSVIKGKYFDASLGGEKLKFVL